MRSPAGTPSMSPYVPPTNVTSRSGTVRWSRAPARNRTAGALMASRRPTCRIIGFVDAADDAAHLDTSTGRGITVALATFFQPDAASRSDVILEGDVTTVARSTVRRSIPL